GAEERDQLPLGHREADVVHGADGGEGLDDLLDVEQWRHARKVNRAMRVDKRGREGARTPGRRGVDLSGCASRGHSPCMSSSLLLRRGAAVALLPLLVAACTGDTSDRG